MKIMIKALNGNFYFSPSDVDCIGKPYKALHYADEMFLNITICGFPSVLHLYSSQAETIRTLLLNECNKTARNILSHPMAKEMLEANKGVV